MLTNFAFNLAFTFCIVLSDPIDFFPKLGGDFNGINFLRFDCDTSKCVIPKHYEELDCKPLIEKGKCCPHSFDCQHLFLKSKTCRFNKNFFKKGEEIDDSIMQSSCKNSCICDEKERINCQQIDCDEKFEPRLNDTCVRQYSLDKCCSTSKVCGVGNIDKLSSCKFEGRLYREGEKMVSQNFKCHICICNKDFNAASASLLIDESTKSCKKMNCLIEMFDFENVIRGCAPIYHPDNCCPHSWRCPSYGDGIIPGPNSNKNLSSPKCKFGNLELSVGDSLSPNELHCAKCLCNIPPFVDCIFTAC